MMALKGCTITKGRAHRGKATGASGVIHEGGKELAEGATRNEERIGLEVPWRLFCFSSVHAWVLSWYCLKCCIVVVVLRCLYCCGYVSRAYVVFKWCSYVHNVQVAFPRPYCSGTVAASVLFVLCSQVCTVPGIVLSAEVVCLGSVQRAVVP